MHFIDGDLYETNLNYSLLIKKYVNAITPDAADDDIVLEAVNNPYRLLGGMPLLIGW